MPTAAPQRQAHTSERSSQFWHCLQTTRHARKAIAVATLATLSACSETPTRDPDTPALVIQSQTLFPTGPAVFTTRRAPADSPDKPVLVTENLSAQDANGQWTINSSAAYAGSDHFPKPEDQRTRTQRTNTLTLTRTPTGATAIVSLIAPSPNRSGAAGKLSLYEFIPPLTIMPARLAAPAEGREIFEADADLRATPLEDDSRTYKGKAESRVTLTADGVLTERLRLINGFITTDITTQRDTTDQQVDATSPRTVRWSVKLFGLPFASDAQIWTRPESTDSETQNH